MNKDLVSWNRPSDGGGIDALGHPIPVSAAGFPAQVRGNFQERTRRAENQDRAGYGVAHDAVLFSESFLTGRDADLVTFGGLTYAVVFVRTRRSLSGPGVAFKAYGLALNQAGAQQVTA